MVVIRLSRVGKKNSPAYRVVVAEKRRAVKRKFIEIIGHYNPTLKPKELKINADRASFWLEKGAQPSNTVRNLMADLGILKKEEKVDIKYARDKRKKELKAEKENVEKPQPKTDVTEKNNLEAPEEKSGDTPAKESDVKESSKLNNLETKEQKKEATNVNEHSETEVPAEKVDEKEEAKK